MRSLISVLAGLLFATQASAGLILDIEDDGGVASFTLSGSDVVVGGSSGINGVWVHGSLVTDMFAVNYTSQSWAVTSGAGEITNTDYGSQSIYDIYTNINGTCCNFGLRNGQGGVLQVGDTISWSGTFTTAMSFASFNAGTYFFDKLTAHTSSGSILQDGITINVGPVSSVPTPAALGLLGVGLLMLGTIRGRRQHV